MIRTPFLNSFSYYSIIKLYLCKSLICKLSVTAAHVVEPILPGARDSYIDLGRFYDNARLRKRLAELTEINNGYKEAYKEAYRYLAAVGKLTCRSAVSASADSIAAAADNCAALVPASAESCGPVRHCFIDSFCWKGFVSSLEALDGWKSYSINAAAPDASAVLKALGELLRRRSLPFFLCHCPLCPDRLRHLLIPDHKIIFTSGRPDGSVCAAALDSVGRHIQLDESCSFLLDTAREKLYAAKLGHDALEGIYNPYVDFSAVREEASKHINTIL